MDSRDVLIDELRQIVAQQAAQLAQQAAQLNQQADRIAQLELKLAKAKKDSSTSSKPPSSDITKPKPRKKPGRRKKPRRGGQPGHQQQLREPLPPDRVDQTIEYEIDDGEVGRLGLTPTGNFDVVQHIELPESPVHVTEYRLAVYQDADGQLYIPDSPEFKGPIFGPRLLATNGCGRRLLPARNRNATSSPSFSPPSQLNSTTNPPRVYFTPNAAKTYRGLTRSRRAAACMAGHLLDRQNKMAHMPGPMVRSQDSRTNRPGLSSGRRVAAEVAILMNGCPQFSEN